MSQQDIRELPDLLRASPHGAAFLRPRGGIVTRDQFADRIEDMAGRLCARGIGAGDTVALAVRPGPDAVAVLLAAVSLGARVFAADPRIPGDIFDSRMRAVGASLTVTEPLVRVATGPGAPIARLAGRRLASLRRSGIPVVTVSGRVPSRPRSAHIDRDVHDPEGPARDTRVRDTAFRDAVVICTSGTTGHPRGVVHSTRSLSAGAAAVGELTGVRQGDIVVATTVFAMLPALLAGAHIAPRVSRSSIESTRPHLTYLTPPQARQLLRHGTRFSGKVFTGSAPVSARLLAQLLDAGADEAWGVYALTEAFPVSAIEARVKAAHTDPGDPVGELLPGVTARTDLDGQLMIAGRGVCDRYVGGERLNEVVTGDRGVVIGTSVVLHGRIKDMVLRDAVNIYPGLHEPALHVPGVAQALLVGVPIDDLDERLALVVEPEPGVSQAAVRRALRGPVAAMGSLRPDRIVVVSRMPTAVRSGKPDRAAAARVAARGSR